MITSVIILLGVIGGVPTNSIDSKKQVIVMSLPGTSNTQYLNSLTNIADFIIEMDVKTKGRDHFFVIHDKSGLSYLNKHNFTNGHLIEVSESLDMWMRDFPPVMPTMQVKFKYRPQHISESQAIEDDRRFEVFAKLVGFPALNRSDLVLEGGNVVENGENAAVTTERIFKDNSEMSREDVIKSLEKVIKRKVAVVPDPQDTTGHADGLVSFVEKDVLLVSLFDDADGPDFYDAMKNASIKAFPSIKVVPLPCYSNKTKSNGFMSAEGSYSNSLVTYNAVYLPFFSNQTNNQIAFDVFQNSTDKEVIPVYKAGKVPVLGGSLRCMTWQIDQAHPVAKSLFAYVENRKKPNGSNHVRPAIALIIAQIGLSLGVLANAFY
ncbi:uncharacterized protein LOC116296588 [Actinia tenebrosa]|uniref:Uncharacterized protein LOC116296588 n=1 Tax=Actinia tenebrosa TaxID=6105 RepID=A0A6P8I6Y5_ACTTE|nr:uncharacterized protein LOC116296588 [Actinia tenebrosa]